MAFKLKYDSSKVDRSKDGAFTPPKAGVYPMVIEEANYEKDNNRIVFVVRQSEPDAEGNGKGYGYWDYVGLDVDWKIDQYLRAVGVDTETKTSGQMTDKTFVGKKIMGRVRIDTEYNPDEPRGKLARVMPFIEHDDEEAEDEDFDEDVEIEDEVDEDADDLDQLGSDADEGDDDAMLRLTELAEAAELDPDEYTTWSELATALGEVETEEEEEEEEAEEEEDLEFEEEDEEEEAEEEAEDYESYSLQELKEELESRKLPSKGSKTALIARLRANDADPF